MRSTSDFYKDRRVLVTGASGFIASHMVARLLAKGARVAGLSRTRGRLDRIALAGSGGFEFIGADLRERESIDAIVAFRPEVLFHFAAQPDSRESLNQAHLVVGNNVAATVNALEGLRLAGGHAFIYADSSKVYGNSEVPYRAELPTAPNSSYAIGKLAGWEYCRLYRRLYGLACASLRPTLIYGPRQAFNVVSYVVNCVLDGKAEVVLDGGEQTRDPLYIDDALEAYLIAGRNAEQIAGAVINIGGGREISVRELVQTVLDVMGSRIPIVCVPAQIRPTEIWRSYCDNREAREILGWSPVTALRDGLAVTVSSLEQERRAPAAV